MKILNFLKRKKSFSQLSAEEKRIAIAKDVIARIKVSQFKPIRGWIWKFSDKQMRETNPLKPLHEIVLEKQNCSVCAKGALFMSCVGFTNNMLFDDVRDRQSQFDDEKQQKSITKVFSKTQLEMIETSYEKKYFGWNYTLLNKQKEQEKCIAFGKKFGNDKDRMIGICKNIIKNNGTFKP